MDDRIEIFKNIIFCFLEIANLRIGDNIPDKLWAFETRKLLKKIVNLALKIDIIVITPNALQEDNFVNNIRSSIQDTLYIISNRFDDSVDVNIEYSNIIFKYNSETQWMTIMGLESFNFLLSLAFNITGMMNINECLSCGDYMISYTRHERKTCSGTCRQRLKRASND